MIQWPKLPDYGIYSVWPQEGIEAFHPDDRDKVDGWVPSDHVFERTKFDGEFYHVRIGSIIELRIKPVLWLPVHFEGLRVGDQVEVLGNNLQNDAVIATIITMKYSSVRQVIEYSLEHQDMQIEKPFTASELVRLPGTLDRNGS